MTLSEIKNFFDTKSAEVRATVNEISGVVDAAKNAVGVKPSAISNTETREEAQEAHIDSLSNGMSKKTKALVVAAVLIGGGVLLYKKFKKAA